jgi:hypothetical protein
MEIYIPSTNPLSQFAIQNNKYAKLYEKKLCFVHQFSCVFLYWTTIENLLSIYIKKRYRIKNYLLCQSFDSFIQKSWIKNTHKKRDENGKRMWSFGVKRKIVKSLHIFHSYSKSVNFKIPGASIYHIIAIFHSQSHGRKPAFISHKKSLNRRIKNYRKIWNCFPISYFKHSRA